MSSSLLLRQPAICSATNYWRQRVFTHMWHVFRRGYSTATVSNASWGSIALIISSIEPSRRVGPSQPRPLHTKYGRSRHVHSSFPASGPAARATAPTRPTGCPEAVDLSHFLQLDLRHISKTAQLSRKRTLCFSLSKDRKPQLDVGIYYFLPLKLV